MRSVKSTPVKPVKKKKKDSQQASPLTPSVQLEREPPVQQSRLTPLMQFTKGEQYYQGLPKDQRVLEANEFYKRLYSVPEVRQAVANSLGVDTTTETSRFPSWRPYDNTSQVLSSLMEMYPKRDPETGAWVQREFPNSPSKAADLYIRHRTDPLTSHIQGRPLTNSPSRDGALGYVSVHPSGFLFTDEKGAPIMSPGSESMPLPMGLGHVMKRGHESIGFDDDLTQSTYVHEVGHASDPFIRNIKSDANPRGHEGAQSALGLGRVKDRFSGPGGEERMKKIIDVVNRHHPDYASEDGYRFMSEYLSNPQEIKARLMELRFALEGNKLGGYTLKDFSNFHPSSRAAAALDELRAIANSDDEVVNWLNTAY
jgi:hypothetical protein